MFSRVYFPSMYLGEGNSNPLQHSCLENSMDRGAWWARAQGVSKSQAWLSSHTHTHTHTHMYLWLGVCEDLWPIFKSGWLLIVDFEDFFVFLYNSHLSDMSFENIFSQSVACLLFLLKLDFTDQNFLNKVQVINYFFMNCALDVVSINVLPCPVSYRFSPMLFSNSFTVVYFKSGLWSILN